MQGCGQNKALAKGGGKQFQVGITPWGVTQGQGPVLAGDIQAGSKTQLRSWNIKCGKRKWIQQGMRVGSRTGQDSGDS